MIDLPTPPVVPVDSQRMDWPRLVANAIKQLQTLRVGTTMFDPDDNKLKYWDGDTWADVP